ncbi:MULTISPECIES: ABC transporter permease [unclassified Chelatococcus]|uniref:ABC transporter permease n=1 Tax=unclassified Chelatococcus TaxID=2638111 RepID=UPI001BD13499|nr:MULTISPECIES: ABC transporter permease [unclassified Chelatococcus]MBS7699760.1 ABC transporter permease [Chelatococcus sp. YT9]MBX3558106.1 ABC transporter permease [Chelatococcus sp.]
MTRFWNAGRNADALFAISLLVAVFALAILVPLLWPVDPIRGQITATFKPPMSVVGGQLHPLGTDQLGRDLLARLGLGTAISLGIVLFASVIAVVLGTLLGMIAGYFGGWLDAVIMRAVDIQLAIPFILLILLIVAVVGPSMLNLIVVLGVTGWAIFARVARARTLEVRDLEYIDASRAIGLSDFAVLLRHVLPNIAGSQIVLVTLDLPRLIILEASVGFLGLGVQPPTPTLGNLIGEGRSFILLANWLVLYPGLVIGGLVVGCNLLGDWLVRRADRRGATT